MELIPVSKENTPISILPIAINDSNENYLLKVPDTPLEFKNTPFIEANTESIGFSDLKNACIIPVFSKDNEKTIAHQEFIDVTKNSISKVFRNYEMTNPEIRVSHQIKGRTPSAIHKSAKELLDNERTQYFERMAFIIRIPAIKHTINGNTLSLTIGGVRAYNRENLYSKKSLEKFQVFIGFQNLVCCNLCISTDGFSSEIKVSSYSELENKIVELLESYHFENHLKLMQNLTKYYLSEHQFAQLIGRVKLYQFLPKAKKLDIPNLLIKDNQISSIAKDYYQDERFCKNEDGNINLWNVYNLFTSANKSSYIDTFLDRNVNVFDFTKSISKAINDSSYHWFLS